MDKFNLTKYFHEGYTTTKVDKAVADSALHLMRSQAWVSDGDPYRKHLGDQVLDNSWKAPDPLRPIWDLKSHKSQTPTPLQDIAADLAGSGYYDWFNGIYGAYTQRTVMGSKFIVGSGLGWHVECCLGTFNANYLILTGDKFEEKDGGQWEMGLCDSDNIGNPIPGTELELETIPVEHGTLITMYNINPNVIRRVRQLNVDKELYVLHFYYGYIENTIGRVDVASL